MSVVVATAAVASATVPVIRPILSQWALDAPNERSSHETPTPRGGGLAIVAALALVLPFSLNWNWHTGGVMAAVGGLAILGFGDDLGGLSVRIRLAAEFGIALAAALLIVEEPLTPAGLALGALGALLVVGFVNAFNFMDGINGISGLMAVVASGWYGYWCARSDLEWEVVQFAVVGSALGFLVWNASGTIFLGDAGSYMLGGVVMLTALELAYAGVHWYVVLAPLIPYLLDTSRTVLVRAARRENVLDAHRDHIYQELTRSGLSHLVVAVVVVTFAVLCCLVALLGSYPVILFAGWVVLASLYLALPRLVASTPAAVS